MSGSQTRIELDKCNKDHCHRSSYQLNRALQLYKYENNNNNCNGAVDICHTNKCYLNKINLEYELKGFGSKLSACSNNHSKFKGVTSSNPLLCSRNICGGSGMYEDCSQQKFSCQK